MSVKGFKIDGATHQYEYPFLDNKPIIDSTLSNPGQLADAKATGDALAEIRDDLSHISGLSDDAKTTLLKPHADKSSKTAVLRLCMEKNNAYILF